MSDAPVPENFSSKDVADASKSVAKDVGRTTLVWTAAGVFTNLIRDLISKVTKNASGK